MSKVYTDPIQLLIVEGRSTLGLTQREFGEALGASHRSAVRWDARQARPSAAQLAKLAQLVFPSDRELARQCAAAAGQTLESLGLEQPLPPPRRGVAAPVGPPTLRPEDMVDLIVLVAVEQSGGPPAEVRRWLHAAFRRAREIGLTVEEVERALAAALKTQGRSGAREEPKTGGA